MDRLSGKVIFSIGERQYRWEDIVLAAHVWNDWTDIEKNVRIGLACLKKDEEENALDQGEIEEAAAEFRYARDLISAEEMETWLNERDLTTQEWMEFIERGLLLERNSEQIDEIVTEFPSDDQEVGQLIPVEGLCSGRLGLVSKRLAGLAAVSNSFQSIADESSSIDIAQMEKYFEDFRGQVINPEAIDKNIHNHSMDWIRFDLHCISFPEEQMIREAILCVKEDGSSLQEIATQTHTEFWDRRVYLERLDPTWSSDFVGAQKGDLLGPFRSGDQFSLFFVAGKIIPSVNDEEIRRRAEEDLLQRMVDHEVNNVVKWHIRL